MQVVCSTILIGEIVPMVLKDSVADLLETCKRDDIITLTATMNVLNLNEHIDQFESSNNQYAKEFEPTLDFGRIAVFVVLYNRLRYV